MTSVRLLPRSCLIAVSALALSVAADTQGPTYIFSTWAGSAATVVKSVDAVGTDAQFDTPRAVAVDRAGVIFVADTGNNTIRKLARDGSVTTIAGSAGREGRLNGPGVSARFTEPFGIAVDDSGTLYVADSSNNMIRRIAPDGVVSTVAGSGTAGQADGQGSAAQFDEPRGVAADRGTSTIYVADYDNHTIRKITASGFVTTIGGRAKTPGHADGSSESSRFRDPMGVAVDSAGVIYVADTGNRAIRRIDASGTVTTLTVSGDSLSDPRGIAVNSDGSLIVADCSSHAVRSILPDGRVRTLAGQAGRAGSADGTGAQARFHYPCGVAIDGAGAIVVADSENDTIRTLQPGGTVTTTAGAAGRTASVDGRRDVARFDDPFAIATDTRGVSYVADSNAHMIRRIDRDGTVTTLAGAAGRYGSADGVAGDARFYSPYGIAVDRDGVVYVADSLNSTVRKITPDGEVSTIAGVAGERGSRDGRGIAARFDQPFGIAVSADGTLFVADATGNTIRRIAADGTVTTLGGLAGAAGHADGIGEAARFTVPYGVAVDSSGIVYVVDHGNHTVRRITTDGDVSTLAGAPGVAGYADGEGREARFRFPSHLSVDRRGNVLVADTDNHAIRRISPTGAVVTIGGAGSPGSVDGSSVVARFFNPKGIAVADDDSVYVADRGNHTVRKGVGTPVNSAGVATLAVMVRRLR